jgi:hypothetical protein
MAAALTAGGFLAGCPSTSSVPTVKSVHVSIAEASLPAGTTTTATATASFSDSTSKDVTTLVSWTSSEATVALVGCDKSPCVVQAIAAGTASLSATYGGVTGSGSVTVSAATLQSVAIVASSSSMPKGAVIDLAAQGSYSDGSVQDVTAQVTWASSTPAVATVSSAGGIVTAVAAGTTSVTASISGMSSSVTLTVTGAVPVSIGLSPTNVSLAQGTSEQLAAQVTFSDGTLQDDSATAEWTSSDRTIADVSVSGLLLAEGIGTATITAKVGGLTASELVTVTAAGVASIAISPSPLSLALGLSRTLDAVSVLTNSQTADVTASATWASSDTTVATVTTAGVVQTVGVGTTVITASVGSIQGTDTVTVTAAAPVSMSVTAPQTSIPAGLTVQLAAPSTLTNGSSVDWAPNASWSSSDTAGTIATVSPTGLLTAIGPGDVTITASAAGASGTLHLTITAAMASLDVSVPSLTLPQGLTEPVSAVATLTNTTHLDVTALASLASSDTTGAVGTFSNGALTAVAPGTLTLTATLGGATGNATVTVVAGISSLAVNPSTLTIPAGLTQVFSAVATLQDTSTLDVSHLASWSTDDTTGAVFTLSQTGLLTAVAPGTASVTATVGTTMSTVPVTVAAAVQSIAVNPPTPSIPVDTSVQLSVQATLTDTTLLDVTHWATWSSDDTAGAIAVVSATGLVQGVSQSSTTVTITATVGSSQASAIVTVTAPAIVSISVQPNPLTIPLGLGQQLTAVALLTTGSTEDVTMSAVWTSSDTTGSVVTVSATGFVQTVAEIPGPVTITVTVNTIFGTAQVTVGAPVLVQISISPSDPTVTTGDTQQLSAPGTLSDLTLQDETASVTWFSPDTTTATFSDTTPGLVSCLMTGMVMVTATIPDPQSTTGGLLTATTTLTCD